MCLPEGMNELFEMVRFERTEQSYDIWLDEKKKLSDEDYRNPHIVARGYTDYGKIWGCLSAAFLTSIPCYGVGWNKKNAMSGVDTAFYVGDSYRIQTCNLLIRSQMLYSVELRSHCFNALQK